MKVLNFLNGYKTYIIGVAMIIVGVYSKNYEMVGTGLGLMGLRQAIYNK